MFHWSITQLYLGVYSVEKKKKKLISLRKTLKWCSNNIKYMKKGFICLNIIQNVSDSFQNQRKCSEHFCIWIKKKSKFKV